MQHGEEIIYVYRNLESYEWKYPTHDLELVAAAVVSEI
jgi:hypothetical protein